MSNYIKLLFRNTKKKYYDSSLVRLQQQRPQQRTRFDSHRCISFLVQSSRWCNNNNNTSIIKPIFNRCSYCSRSIRSSSIRHFMYQYPFFHTISLRNNDHNNIPSICMMMSMILPRDIPCCNNILGSVRFYNNSTIQKNHSHDSIIIRNKRYNHTSVTTGNNVDEWKDESTSTSSSHDQQQHPISLNDTIPSSSEKDADVTMNTDYGIGTGTDSGTTTTSTNERPIPPWIQPPEQIVNHNTNEHQYTITPIKQSNRTQRNTSEYNTRMNNFNYASYPPKSKVSRPINPIQKNNNGQQQMDHPVFITARQLLNITIGSFNKHHYIETDSTKMTPMSIQQPQLQPHHEMNHNNSNMFAMNPNRMAYNYRNNHKVTNPPFASLNHYQVSYNMIQFLLNDRAMCMNHNVRAINATFAIIERLIREISFTNTMSQNIHYLFKHNTQFRLLMNYWKNTALIGGHVLPAVEMVKKIQWMTIELQRLKKQESPIQFDKHILSMIMQVLIKQVPKKEAPFLAEQLLDVINETIDVVANGTMTDENELQPDSVIYVQLLNAWMNSNLPQTAQKMEKILNEMRLRDVPITSAIYSILIRYYGNQGSILRVRAVLERMEHDHVPIDISCLGQAIHAYTRAMQPLQAIKYLEQMHHQINNNDNNNSNSNTNSNKSQQDIITITACTLNILDSFKRLIIRGNDIDRNILRAEDVVRKLETNSVIQSRSDGRYFCIFSLYLSYEYKHT
jgi:pentatricopeptide repeat protein